VRGVLLLLAVVACTSGVGEAGRQRPTPDELRMWREFVTLVRAGNFPSDRIKPYREELRAPLLGFLETMRAKADWHEWDASPETFRVGDEVHFLLPLTFDGHTRTFSFSFVREHGRWSFEHMEGISIRMDEVGRLPAHSFPDLPDTDKAWMREEIEVTREVHLYNALAAEKGAAAALQWFNDGQGYALAARTWVPFVAPSRAFILYLCWEQANLRGNGVVLERLDADTAVVRITPLYYQLYERTGHLKLQITPDAYRTLYETRWQDRASAAGWDVAISCAEGRCLFRFVRPPGAS